MFISSAVNTVIHWQNLTHGRRQLSSSFDIEHVTLTLSWQWHRVRIWPFTGLWHQIPCSFSLLLTVKWLIFLPLRPRIRAAVETVVVKQSHKWRSQLKLSWHPVVISGASGLGRSFILPVNANFQLKREIVDWLTLNRLASLHWLMLAWESPVICPLESLCSFGIINAFQKRKISNLNFKPQYQMSTSCSEISIKRIVRFIEICTKSTHWFRTRARRVTKWVHFWGYLVRSVIEGQTQSLILILFLFLYSFSVKNIGKNRWCVFNALQYISCKYLCWDITKILFRIRAIVRLRGWGALIFLDKADEPESIIK